MSILWAVKLLTDLGLNAPKTIPKCSSTCRGWLCLLSLCLHGGRSRVRTCLSPVRQWRYKHPIIAADCSGDPPSLANMRSNMLLSGHFQSGHNLLPMDSHGSPIRSADTDFFKWLLIVAFQHVCFAPYVSYINVVYNPTMMPAGDHNLLKCCTNLRCLKCCSFSHLTWSQAAILSSNFSFFNLISEYFCSSEALLYGLRKCVKLHRLKPLLDYLENALSCRFSHAKFTFFLEICSSHRTATTDH